MSDEKILQEPREFEALNGTKYKIYPFDGLKGRNIIIRMIDLLKPDASEMNSASMGKALVVGSFVGKGEKLIDDLLESVFHVKEEAMIKLDKKYTPVHFARNYGTMMELIIEVCDFNGFFDLIGYLPESMTGLLNMNSART